MEDRPSGDPRTVLPARGSESDQAVAAWCRRVEAARQHGLPGDMLVLADEAPTALLAVEARRSAGECLFERQQFELALEQFDAALAIDPGHHACRQWRVRCLSRLGRHARDALRALNEADDAGALAGGVEIAPGISSEQFRPAESAAAPEAAEHEPGRPAPAFVPRQVILFSGHMVDAPDRPAPRFPPGKVPAARAAIEHALDAFGAGPGDLLLTQGAAGGDLICAAACMERGVRVQLLLPLAEPEFVRRSILPSAGGEGWRDQYFALKAALPEPPRILPAELGPTPAGADEFERCNRWLLSTALAHGPRRVRFVCLWDGGGGDGPGGTAHMHDEVERHQGQVTRIDPRAM